MIKEKQVAGVAVPLPTRIIEVRGVKVLLDADLAELYAVSTKALNQAIKRNRQKFPPDFMFRLTKGEKAEVVQTVTTSNGSNFPIPCRWLSPNMGR
ncbi:MAG: ORF6N domain-containing protein [Candidatus Binatia bacterium]